MKAKRYIVNVMGMAAALLLCLGGCVKYDLHPASTSVTIIRPDPDPGTEDTTDTNTSKVTITADWTNRGAGVEIPASWAVSMGDYTGTETGETHTPDCLFEAGNYTLVVWNPADEITVSGTMATVDADNANANCISGTPGWFFTSVQDVTIEPNTDTDTAHELTAAMQQQVRQLTLVLKPIGDAADLIESIEGNLSGVAGTLDFETDTHDTPSNVALSFTKITEGNDAGRWSVTVRLLGIADDYTQTLTATITYTDSNLQDSSLNSDLTAVLANFNANKTTPMTLGATLETPDEADFTATIGDWESVGNEEVDLQ